MNSTHFQLARREMRQILTSPRVLTGLAAASLILGISGPFQTFSYLPLGPRLAYWAVLTVASFAVGGFFGTWSEHKLQPYIKMQAIRVFAVGVASGVPVFVVVSLINLLAFADLGSNIISMSALLFYCVAISTAVALMFELIGGQSGAGRTEPTTDQPRLLQRLNAKNRGPLISLSVSDHYVEVTTQRGRELVLMRLSDAIGEAEGCPGLQIHRSHWVALAGIKSARRHNTKILVETSVGTELPVSRSFAPRLKEAGILA